MPAAALLGSVSCAIPERATGPVEPSARAQAPAERPAPPPRAGGSQLPSLAPMLSRVIPGVVNISTTSRVRVRLHPLLADPIFRQLFQIPDVTAEPKRTVLT